MSTHTMIGNLTSSTIGAAMTSGGGFIKQSVFLPLASATGLPYWILMGAVSLLVAWLISRWIVNTAKIGTFMLIAIAVVVFLLLQSV